MKRFGDFSCSEQHLNQLHQNAVWSMRGNFFSIPTDCPQRDERLGWTGDVALFTSTAVQLYDCAAILQNWLHDAMHEQNLRGGIPSIVTPDVFTRIPFWGDIWPCVIWHDVVILTPWDLYQATGDIEILSRHFPGMCHWLESIPRDGQRQGDLWDPTMFQFGDWLDPSAPPEEPSNGKTDSVLVANAFLVRSLRLVAQIAMMLGRESYARKVVSEAHEASRRFAEEYITSVGRVVADSQTAYALAICFDLFPTETQKMRAGQRLAMIVRQNSFKIATGFAGTPFICKALVLTGQSQVAYAMLLNRECPSWLYPVSRGATTIWERWNSMLPDNSISSGGMTSFNHFCFGAVVLFLYESLAGLQRLEPGWKTSRAAPIIGANITNAQASCQTPYGQVSCAWVLVRDKFLLDVLVPPTTVMEIRLRGQGDDEAQVVGAGRWKFEAHVVKDYEWPVKPLALPW